MILIFQNISHFNNTLMSTIDLRKNGQLEDQLKHKFQEVLGDCVSPFHEYIEKVSEGVSGDIDWWVSTPVSRDTIYSNLFHNFTILFFVNRLLKEDVPFESIIVDDFYLKEIMSEFFHLKNKDIKVHLDDEGKYQRSFFRNFYEIIRFHFIFFIKLFFCKFLLRSKVNIPPINGELVLIDTFFLDLFRSKERYYDGLLENLSSQEKRYIFFVPSVLDEKITTLYNSIKFLRSYPEKYLLKEDFLKFRDLFFTFGYFFRKNKIKFNQIDVLGCSFHKLVKAELLYLNRFLMSIEGLLSYRFVKNLRQKKIKVRTSVNWFENQPMDKGWNLGFNSFYKESINLGYRGLVPANYFLSQKYITDFEFNNSVTPKKLFTVGDNEGLEASRFTKRTALQAGPAFRFRYLWSDLPKTNEQKDIIFVALPITLQQSTGIMEGVNSINDELKGRKAHFLIKLHPTMDKSLLLNNLSFTFPENMAFTSDEASSILVKSALIISGMSSICLEACAVGVPLIVYNSQNLIPFNSLPNNISKKTWKNVSNKKELTREVKNFLNMKKSEKEIVSLYSETVKKDNFKPVNNSTVKELLKL
ncbi:MAG: hypothetical protein CMD90_01465 [Gammaproteobacteria bacterium]|nr:hypothetical protein [Gammaproteobacteria bacterium]